MNSYIQLLKRNQVLDIYSSYDVKHNLIPAHMLTYVHIHIKLFNSLAYKCIKKFTLNINKYYCESQKSKPRF